MIELGVPTPPHNQKTMTFDFSKTELELLSIFKGLVPGLP